MKDEPRDIDSAGVYIGISPEEFGVVLSPSSAPSAAESRNPETSSSVGLLGKKHHPSDRGDSTDERAEGSEEPVEVRAPIAAETASLHSKSEPAGAREECSGDDSEQGVKRLEGRPVAKEEGG